LLLSQAATATKAANPQSRHDGLEDRRSLLSAARRLGANLLRFIGLAYSMHASHSSAFLAAIAQSNSLRVTSDAH
jgi:hypothetical protein